MSDKLTNFGYGFQIKVVSSLLTDKAFLQQVTDILLPDFFESDANQWIVETINKYLRDSVVGNIYIHCQCGINRSGFSLVKRINTNLVFINYFEIPLKYYKNLCDDQSNYVFKGRCYSACPSGYVDIGLSCIQTDASSDVISLFDPDSNYCKQICKTSDDDVSVYDPIIQKACWCKSMKCDKCSEYNIKECNC